MFYWQYSYPNGVVAVDRLRLPVGRPVRLELVGADVVHSWWVPELTGKRQAIPGRVNRLDFTINRPDTYGGQCSFFCGVQHTEMYTEVEAIPQQEFDTWVAAQRTAQLDLSSDLGKQTWEGVCAKCHGLDGKGGYGPEIAGNSTLSTKASLARLLANGQDNEGIPGFMPPVSQGWPEQQLDALIDYLVGAGLAPQPADQGQGE
jgi:cytochrome c oxidase subunit II